MNEKKSNRCVQNVGCCVKDCRYHSNTDYCNAERISVANEYATEKAQTFCSTFEKKSCC